MSLRATLWKLHRWIGLACALPFAVLAVTGTGLLVSHALGAGAAPRLDQPAASLAGVDPALAAIRARYHDASTGLILPAPDSRHAWLASVRSPAAGSLTIPFDPATGEIYPAREAGSATRETLLSIHNSLLLGIGGKVIALLTAIAVLMLTISGFAVMRRRLRILATRPSSIAGLHKWIGLIGCAFLLVWSSSGFLLLGFKTLGETRRSGPPRAAVSRPASDGVRAPLGPILEAALAKYPGTELQGIMPGQGAGPVTVMLLDRSAAPWSKSRTIAFDGGTGAMVPDRPSPTFMKVMIAAKSLHTGLWDGILVLGLYLFAAALCLVLIVTGPWLWLRRRSLRRQSR